MKPKPIFNKPYDLIISAALVISTFFYFFTIRLFPILNIQARQSHNYYFEALKSIITIKTDDLTGLRYMSLSPFFNTSVFIGSLVFLTIMLLQRKGFNQIRIKLRPIYLMLAFYLCAFFLLFLWKGFTDAPDSVLLAFLSASLPALLIVISVIMITISVGKKALTLFTHTNFDISENLIFFFGIGVFLISAIVFLLGLFGKISFTYILLAMVLVMLFSAKELWFWLKQFFQKNISFSLDIRYGNSIIWISLFLLIVFSQCFLKLLIPFPWGNDEIVKYLNEVRLISESHFLIKGSLPYPWTLYDSIPFILLNNSVRAARILTFTTGVFSSLGLFVLIKNYFTFTKNKINSVLGLLPAALFISMPMVLFQLTSDLKVDLASFFMATLAMIAWLKWEIAKKQGEPKDNLLKLCAFFAGFSILIKVTAIVLFVPLFAYVVFSIIKSFAAKKAIRLILSIAIFFCLAFSYFAPFNVLSWPKFSRNMFLTSYDNPREDFGKFYSSTDQLLRSPSSANQFFEASQTHDVIIQDQEYDYGRFSSFGRSAIKKIFLTPFDKTYNWSLSGAFVDIGYVFLLLTILLIPIAILQRKEKLKNINLTLFLAISTYLVWLFTCQQVPWYGITGFIPLLLLITDVLVLIKGSLTSTIFKSLMSAWLLFILILQLNVTSASLSFGKENILSLYPKTTADKFEDYTVFLPKSEYNKINSLLAGSPENILYTNNCLNTYFIDKNNKQLLCDSLLTSLNILYYDRDTDKTVERLKKYHIKYILFDTNSRPDLKDNPAAAKFWNERIPELLSNKNIENIPDFNTKSTLFYEIK